MTVRTASSILGLVVLAYLGVFVWFSPLLLQDFPNHLARSLVMADLLFRHGESFGQDFQFHFMFATYALGDLLLATLVRAFGLAAAANIWPALTFLSLPCALSVYLRVKNISTEVTLLMLLVSLYLSTDTFFTMGFLEFKLSLALVLVALALVELLRQEWRLAYFAVFTAVMVIAYLVHLVAVAFVAAAVVTSALLHRIRGNARLDREAYLLLPIGCLLAWHVLSAAGHHQGHDEVVGRTHWGTVTSKLTGLGFDFVRYSSSLDGRLGLAFATVTLACVMERRIFRKQVVLDNAQVLEPLVYALMFTGLYFVFPFENRDGSYVDVRAMPLATLFGTLALLNLPRNDEHGPSRRLSAPAIWLATAVAAANLGYFAINFRTQSDWLHQYRAIVASIPERSTVLPIDTLQIRGNVYVELHAASFAVIDRHALIPYLFSADRGNPMKYFRYATHYSAPDELWYIDHGDQKVDWTEVRQQYPYLLVTKPFEPDRIRVKTRIVAENDAAALLQVQ